jgi:DNA primase
VIPPAFIQDLLGRIDIVEVVGRHVELRRSGANFAGLCPFHSEKSPSFTVAPSKQFYHCFGCGAHGDAIRFLTEHTGMSFVDAVAELAQQAGMTVPEDRSSPEERERASALKERQATLTDVLARAAEHYCRQLKTSARAVDYLKRRGLNGQIARRYGIGYAPEGWRGLASVFPRYDDALLEDAGLVIAHDALGDDGSDRKRYDRFRDRIMFPIRSVQGEIIGFGGRVLDRGEPKYLNSPETPVFIKGRELYGLHEARAALREKGYALVVEGYMDVVALAQHGFPNAVATLGTSCTAEHVHKLLRFTDSVVFSFDGDAAGRRAASRALEAALPHATDTRSIRFLFLPADHDPDSYVRELGAEAFDTAVMSAVPLSRQLLDTASADCDLNTAEGRARMLAAAKPLWSALPEGALRRQLLVDLASAARLDLADLQGLWQIGHARRTPDGPPSHALKRPAAPLPARPSRGTANLLDRALWLLVQRSDLWLTLDDNSHDLLAEQAAPYAALFSVLERAVHDHGTIAREAILEELKAQAEPVDAGAIVSRVREFLPPDPDADLARDLAIVMDRLRLQGVEDELKLLFESGTLSAQAQQRGKELDDERRRLKALLVRSSEPSTR